MRRFTAKVIELGNDAASFYTGAGYAIAALIPETGEILAAHYADKDQQKFSFEDVQTIVQETPGASLIAGMMSCWQFCYEGES